MLNDATAKSGNRLRVECCTKYEAASTECCQHQTIIVARLIIITKITMVNGDNDDAGGYKELRLQIILQCDYQCICVCSNNKANESLLPATRMATDDDELFCNDNSRMDIQLCISI